MFAKPKNKIILYFSFLIVIPTVIISYKQELAHFLKLTPGCLFYNWTSIKCPGCGGTRATIALLEGRFSEVLPYNYLWVPTLLFILYELIIRFQKRRGIELSNHALKAQSIIEKTYLYLVIIFMITRNIFDF